MGNATLTMSQINAATRAYVEKNVANNVTKSDALLYRLSKKAKNWKGGATYEIPIWYANNTNAASYTGAGALTILETEELTRARFYPRQYNVAITLTGLDMAEGKGEGAIIDLVSEKVKHAEASLKQVMGTDIYALQTSSKLDGLLGLMGDSAVAYGGITQGDSFLTWLCNGGKGPDLGTTTLTPTVMSKMFNNTMLDGDFSDGPSLVVTTSDIHAGMEASFFTSKVLISSDKNLVDLGFQTFKYRGADVVWSPLLGASKVMILNEKHLWLATFPGKTFAFRDFEAPVDYDRWTAHITWYGNLVSDARWKHGYLGAITTVSSS